MEHEFSKYHLMPEKQCVETLLNAVDWDFRRVNIVNEKTRELLKVLRQTKASVTEIETFLEHYPLTSPEGLALMTMSEALLRIPDAETADMLIAEKMANANWGAIGGEGFLFKMAGKGLSFAQKSLNNITSIIAKPIIRKTMHESVKRLGKQFVVGANIKDALALAYEEEKTGYRLSFDMLGEGARTIDDAKRYFAAYVKAIEAVGAQKDNKKSLFARHGISVKLSALHPRYHWTQAGTCVPEIAASLLQLAILAKSQNITLTIDAEEADRLEMSIDILSLVSSNQQIAGWNGLGLAIQAYDKRCFALIDDIAAMAKRDGRVMQVRLVKGAYWDTEIKRAQNAGLNNYPVFTRKKHTDLSYIACAQKLLKHRDVLYPMFAGHNAQTVISLLEIIGDDKTGFEFQRLYGMGKSLGDWLCEIQKMPVTIYAPVGGYEDLLPYLVRRMLENGANTSFVAQMRDSKISIDKLSNDPINDLREENKFNSPIPLPTAIYDNARINSNGYDLSNPHIFNEFMHKIKLPDIKIPQQQLIDTMFLNAQNALPLWRNIDATERANILYKCANMLEGKSGELIALLQDEGKKTISDAIAEIRETVDFCRYYASEGEKLFNKNGITLNGITGEKNTLRLNGRGTFVCISPWNFPLAIFMGQITAALMAGNTVIAKPAEQTPRIAIMATQILHDCGVPPHVLQIAIGDGVVGSQLINHQNVAGVAFTGSTTVARFINRALAAKDGAIVPLIAETGGQNAMIVDSSALPEQAVDDVIMSAFGSAGQRCSALRVLYIQEEIAERVIDLLRGAINLLRVGDAKDISTDIPPVIDEDALNALNTHKTYLNSFAKKIAEAPLNMDLQGTYFAPVAYEIDTIHHLKGEVFGPILHVIRFAACDMDRIIDDINNTGFGLTFGMHSRLNTRFDDIAGKINAGNIYINRGMTGAVVGVQPFGGQGLSGTGPKAGGPHYLARFATEQSISVNTVATGGNIDLLNKIKD